NVGRDSNKTNLREHSSHIPNVLFIGRVSGNDDDYRKSAFLVGPGQIAIKVFRSALEGNSFLNHIRVVQSLYWRFSVWSLGFLCFEVATQGAISREQRCPREEV